MHKDKRIIISLYRKTLKNIKTEVEKFKNLLKI